MRKAEIANNLQSHFLLAPLWRGLCHPLVSRETREALSLPQPFCWKLSTALKSQWVEKGIWNGQEHSMETARFRAITEVMSCHFFPVLLRFCWAAYVHCLHTLRLMHLFQCAWERLCFDECSPDLSRRDDKDTRKELISSPGYIANGCLLLAAPTPGNTYLSDMVATAKEIKRREKVREKLERECHGGGIHVSSHTGLFSYSRHGQVIVQPSKRILPFGEDSFLPPSSL